MTIQQHLELQVGGVRPASVEGYFFLNLNCFCNHNAIIAPFCLSIPSFLSNAAEI